MTISLFHTQDTQSHFGAQKLPIFGYFCDDSVNISSTWQALDKQKYHCKPQSVPYIPQRFAEIWQRERAMPNMTDWVSDQLSLTT